MPRHRRGWAVEGVAGENERHTPLKVSLLEPALLILLKEQPRHGYTFLTDLGSLNMGSIHPSVIYRTLREMEALEWVESDWDTSQTQGPPRRTYRLTANGDAALLNWRTELESVKVLIQQLMNRTDESRKE